MSPSSGESQRAPECLRMKICWIGKPSGLWIRVQSAQIHLNLKFIHLSASIYMYHAAHFVIEIEIVVGN